ncbi:hypothetical protein [Hyperthermus butylicus]|uniref:Uncharacterized protein n=1 Tax=Hyperthermus butylicus (strain DSM 5456 / JCM 9403 / PLM1-5) TaxID=415426 RepID=A2BJB2_HYPBU|nr:hypothetical protein [Hyperthermus butylicus]ABM80073.1 hypothetical protein Hbut_0201 [Hyperthermus butylicus DSM 5456]
MLRLRLYSVALREYGVVVFQVGAGYEGQLMLPRGNHWFLMVGELPRSPWRAYGSPASMAAVKVAHAVVEVAGRRLETYVESPLHCGGMRLAGRELLNMLKLLLDGPAGRTCIQLG